jgi:DNA-directed RNA polymerase subunit D
MEFKNLDVSILNSLRRVILTNIPSYSLDNFKVINNHSPFMDEYITHRIGLIPIFSRMASNAPEGLFFKLSIEGNTYEIRSIYSKDIVSSDGKRYFPDNCLVTKLKGIPNHIESVDIEMSLSVGTGEISSKYSVVNVVALNPSKNGYILDIEANEKQPSEYTFKQAIDIIVEKLENIRNLGPEKIKFLKLKSNFYEIMLLNENHTIGNLFKRYIDNKYPSINCGYFKPHPLTEEIRIKITTNKPQDIIIETCNELIKVYNSLKKNT